MEDKEFEKLMNLLKRISKKIDSIIKNHDQVLKMFEQLEKELKKK